MSTVEDTEVNGVKVIKHSKSVNTGTSRDYNLSHPYAETLKTAIDYYGDTSIDISQDVIPSFTSDINPHKVFHLMRYRGDVDALSSLDASGMAVEDWRNYGSQISLDKYTNFKHNSFLSSTDAGKINPVVSEHVLLFSDSKSIEFEMKNTFGRPIAALLDKLVNSTVGRVANDGLALIAAGTSIAQSSAGTAVGDAIGSLVSAAPAIAGNQQFMLKYKNIPAWTGTENLSIPGSLTFKFAFGQAGLFDAAEEVVRPILSLAMYFAPSENDSMVSGILPTESYVKIMGAYAVASTASTAMAKMINPTGGATGIIEGIQGVYSALNSSVSDIYNKNARGIMIARYGNILIPPFVVASVKWKFDMSQVDENGYPYKGELTLGGIESFQMATQRLIQSTVSKQFAPKKGST